MRKYYYDLLILIPFFFLSSCATILNRKTTNVHVYTNMPATILTPSAKSNREVTNCDFAVARSKKPLTITAYNDTIRKTVTVKPIHSFAYWLNLSQPPYSFIGFIIDRATDKRFTYPVNIYLDLTSKDSTYRRMIPVPAKYEKRTFIVSLAPLKIIAPVNPVIEVTGEKKVNASFSVAAMFGYLLRANYVTTNDSSTNPNIRGLTAGLEGKWFIHRSAPQGFYIALGFNYLENHYRASANFEHSLPDTTFPPTILNYRDTFGIYKQTYTINLMIGYQRIFKRFSVDIYGGLGLRFKNVQHIGRKYPGDYFSSRTYGDFGVDYFYLTNRPGKYDVLAVPLNIRLGWTF